MILGSIDITQLLSLLAFNRDEPMLFTSGLFWVMFLLFLPVYSLLKSRRKKMMLFVIAFSLYFFYKSSGVFFLLLVGAELRVVVSALPFAGFAVFAWYISVTARTAKRFW